MPKRWLKTQGFDETNSVNVVAGVTGTILYSLRIPHSTALKIKHFGNNVQPVGGWGLTTWRLKINGASIRPLREVKDQLGTIGDPTELGETPIARGGDLLEIEVDNTSATNNNISARLKGEFGREY